MRKRDWESNLKKEYANGKEINNNNLRSFSNILLTERTAREKKIKKPRQKKKKTKKKPLFILLSPFNIPSLVALMAPFYALMGP